MSKMIDDNSLNMSGYSIEEMYVGQRASVSKTITESDIHTFAGIIGDVNPVHVNVEYATPSFLSTIVGMCIPGADAIYLSQELKFLLPVKIGDTITATGVVTKIIEEKKIGHLDMTITNQRGEVVVAGEGKVMATK